MKLGITLSFLVLMTSASHGQTPGIDTPFPAPGRLVNIGGRKLHILCTGEGKSHRRIGSRRRERSLSTGRLCKPGLTAQRVYACLDFLSSNSLHITAVNSGHEIHLYQPDLVVQALKRAVIGGVPLSR